MKKAIFILLLGFVFGLTGCGKSAQEQVAEEQLKSIQQKKIDDERRKSIMGSGSLPMPTKDSPRLGGL